MCLLDGAIFSPYWPWFTAAVLVALASSLVSGRAFGGEEKRREEVGEGMEPARAANKPTQLADSLRNHHQFRHNIFTSN